MRCVGAHEDMAAKLASLRSEWLYRFRKKGHGEQHSFNASVQRRLVEAGLQLNRAERDVEEEWLRHHLKMQSGRFKVNTSPHNPASKTYKGGGPLRAGMGSGG